jgi:hypothetical protein
MHTVDRISNILNDARVAANLEAELAHGGYATGRTLQLKKEAQQKTRTRTARDLLRQRLNNLDGVGDDVKTAVCLAKFLCVPDESFWMALCEASSIRDRDVPMADWVQWCASTKEGALKEVFESFVIKPTRG